MCAGTRSRERRETLVRWFIGSDGTPWPDWTGRSARVGRGAHTEPTVEAVQQALVRGGFRRAFAREIGEVTVDTLVERMVVLGRKAFFNRIGLANRAAVLAVGQTACRERFVRGIPALLLVAADVGSAARTKFTVNARRRAVPIATVASGNELGLALGREFVGVVLVEASVFADDLKCWARALAALPSTGVVDYEESPVADVTDRHEDESGLESGD